MPFQMSLWKVSDGKLVDARQAKLDLEQHLENWIADDPSITGLDILILGRQVPTSFGGRIDLLGIDRQAHTVVLELKRDRTPRDVVAQVLDYATWVKDLTYQELDAICTQLTGKNLVTAYAGRFGESIPESVNGDHSMVIVASELDDSSERIVQYLVTSYHVNINAVFFNVFAVDNEKYLGRAWLMDPEDVERKIDAGKRPPWPGYWFVNVGEGPERNWDDNLRYGYLGAGQGLKYANALRRLGEGDRFFAYMSGMGYVGYGEVTRRAVMIKDFLIEPDGKSLLDMPLKAPCAGDNRDVPELAEWVIGVTWIKTFTRDNARSFKGIFANPNVVCKLSHQPTLEYLKKEFDVE